LPSWFRAVQRTIDPRQARQELTEVSVGETAAFTFFVVAVGISQELPHIAPGLATKIEIRNPKSERKSKSESLNSKQEEREVLILDICL
jgi:hypothetical protein